jgi:hypothetical protein
MTHIHHSFLLDHTRNEYKLTRMNRYNCHELKSYWI